MSKQLLLNCKRLLNTFENANRATTENTSGTRVRESRDARIFSIYYHITPAGYDFFMKAQEAENAWSRLITKDEEPCDLTILKHYNIEEE